MQKKNSMHKSISIVINSNRAYDCINEDYMTGP